MTGHRPSAIIVGAGIGGLAAAGRLARAGFCVTVVERLPMAGGRLTSFAHEGFRFDTGPTILLMPHLFAETFESLGERLEDHLELVRVDPAYTLNFHDGSRLVSTSDLVRMREQLDSFAPGSFDGYLRFLATAGEHYRVAFARIVGRNFDSLLEFAGPAQLPLLLRLHALESHHRHTSRFFRDERLRAAFTFQNMYLGVSPFDAPATFTLLQYSERTDGIWFPRGGLAEVAARLLAIDRALGVEVLLGAPVSRIALDERSQRATGVELGDGTVLRSDVVVVNADLPYAYRELLPDAAAAAAFDRKRYSASAIVFYWGIDGPRDDALAHHNAFLADHAYRESFVRIFGELGLPDEPSFYVCAPTRTDPSFAPPDGDSLMVLVPVGHLSDTIPQDWPAVVARAREFVLARLARHGIPDLASRIRYESVRTPEFYASELNLARGAIYGLSHTLRQLAYFRPANRHASIRDLYFVGASTHPGTGLPIVLTSARLTVERILGRGSAAGDGRRSAWRGTSEPR